jgi:S-adenosylmethionine:tRNA ribosyltransferase-isomerase
MNDLRDFDYELPAELIAQEPAPSRDLSRLLVVHRDDGRLEDTNFGALPDHLRPGDLLVANQSRVIPARIRGTLAGGGKVELLLVRPLADCRWDVMARPAKKLRPGTVVQLDNDVTATVTGTGEMGRRIVRIAGTDEFQGWLGKHGELPIPPYIHRYPDNPERYQTVYARVHGSVAAPTAGLHFTPELLDRLRAKGVEVRFVTLHVGPGTFKPVREERLDAVRLEPEWGSVDEATAEAVNRARADGRRMVAVGTTTTRLMEGIRRYRGTVIPWQGEVDLFIRPPYEFGIVDALITNFHLPRSTLLMLVSAFAGLDTIRHAYAHAIAERYRFYSFGDAMFIV